MAAPILLVMSLLSTILPPTLRAPIARGFALFLGLFTLLNLLGSLRIAGFDANEWWIDLAYLPPYVTNTGLAVAAVALLCFGVGFPNHFLVRWGLKVVSAALSLAVLINTAVFYGLWAIGRIHPGSYIPFSLLLSIVFSFMLAASFGDWKLPAVWQKLLWVAVFAGSFVAFPVAQMYCFGTTDYRRDADAIVVFGCRAYADGTPSQALADRVKTGVDLYQEKRASLLIFSGGPGDGAVSEPEAMRRLAVSLGVPGGAIVLDEKGFHTDETVASTVEMMKDRHWTKVLAVSHDYHLPRVKMTYQRALHPAKPGEKPVATVYTVPAKESAPLSQRYRNMLREVVALWVYYLRPLTGAAST